MREKLIKFKPEMHPLIYSGEKTQTRRPWKPTAKKPGIGECPYGGKGDGVLFGNPGKFNILIIKKVSIERLQDISESDAQAEGITGYSGEYWIPGGGPSYSAASAFRVLWESIYGADSWNLNPWVWVIHFELYSEANATDQGAEK